MSRTGKLSEAEKAAMLRTLARRFEENEPRHSGLQWAAIQRRLEAAPAKLLTLHMMEESGGEPDVIGVDENGSYLFCDCSEESPKGRRSLCYDEEALEKRKENKPKGSAAGMAADFGAELMDENDYRSLQSLGEFDKKTSSWIATPPGIRRLGGALFCDRRYNHVFTYHNGAESYYAARGFRAKLLV